MTKEIKVGLMGEFRSGKNTVADYLTEKYSMVQFAFATELKNGFHKEYPHISAHPHKPREGYQLYGQLKRYVYGENYWINLTLDEVEQVKREGERQDYIDPAIGFRPVITDVRYPNERERLEEEGYTIIKIYASDEIKIARAEAAGDNFRPEALKHVSEAHIFDAPCDYAIINNGTLEELYAQVDAIMEDILNDTKAVN